MANGITCSMVVHICNHNLINLNILHSCRGVTRKRFLEVLEFQRRFPLILGIFFMYFRLSEQGRIQLGVWTHPCIHYYSKNTIHMGTWKRCFMTSSFKCSCKPSNIIIIWVAEHSIRLINAEMSLPQFLRISIRKN